jgi:choline dehydrogenase-like flavoprotein
MADKTDVLIVGAGAAGSVFAARLATAGKKVVVLEAGPGWKLNDLVSSQIWSRRIKWRGAPVLSSGSLPVNNNFGTGSGVGGAALHHYAVWPRLHEEDFEMRSRHGRGLDWPVAYDVLRPWYDRVQAEVGVAGDANAEVWRPAGEPYPMGPVPLLKQAEVLARGFERHGLRTAPLPQAITTEPYKGRRVCIWDGWGDASCPIGALANPLVTYLKDARQAGAEVRPNTEVLRLDTNASGSRVTGVTVANERGEVESIEADFVVLAANTVQNPRLLLNSAPGGLANSSGLVGAYLTTHIGISVYGLFEEDTYPYLGTPGGMLVSQDDYDGKDTRGAGFGSYQWQIAPSTKPNDLLGHAMARPDIYGEALHQFMRRAARGFAAMTAVVEDLPVPENEVSLAETNDKRGVPLARMTHSPHADSSALAEAARQQGEAVMKAAGAVDSWSAPPVSMHLMGGTIMGEDPAASVTDSYGRAHDLENLFLAGPGLMPTIGGVNPTFTVTALAERSAHYLVENYEAIQA